MTQPFLNARSARVTQSTGIDTTRIVDRTTVEAAVYERTQACGQTTEKWDLNVRQFKLNEDGKLMVLSRYSTGDQWDDAEKAGASGKQRFAVELCTFRDGKVFDHEGKEVTLNKPLGEDSFKDSDLAMAWGADKSDRQGKRLIIRREKEAPLSPSAAELYDIQPSPSDLPAYHEPRSPSDRPVPVLQPTRTQLREWTACTDRCGRTVLTASERFHDLATDNGRLVTVDAKGENPQPLDLKKHGILHLRMHEGRFYNAESGAEVPLNYKIDPAQLEGRQFFEFRGIGRDSNHYFITDGLPTGQSIEQKQLVRTECLRDSNGCFHQERVYSLSRSVVPEAMAKKQYTLSADGTELNGFEAVTNGETHPEYGTLRFIFKPEGKEQIRVYEKPGYEDSTWTFLQRDEQVRTHLDANGCQFRAASTSWIRNDQMSVKPAVVPYDEYSPPVIELPIRRPALNHDDEPAIDFNAGDPFSKSSGQIRASDLHRIERAQLAALSLPGANRAKVA